MKYLLIIAVLILAFSPAIAGDSDRFVYATDFGANCQDGEDDTRAINQALEAARVARKSVVLPAGQCILSETTPDYMLLNRGVSMYGAGANFNTTLIAGPEVGNTADFIRFRPEPGDTEYSFVELTGFFIYPDARGRKQGRRGIHFLFDSQNNAAKLWIHHLRMGPGNDYSIQFENHPTLNQQGVPSNSLISDNFLFDGIMTSNIGDSNTFTRNTIRTSSVLRKGIRLHVIDGGFGSAGHTVISENNIDAKSNAIEIMNGRRPQIIYNNIEQSAGGDLTSGLIEIGTAAFVDQPLVYGNHIGVFGTSIQQYGIRVAAANMARIDDNSLLSDSARTAAIKIESWAANTLIGVNQTSGWAFPANNNSPSTRRISTQPF